MLDLKEQYEDFTFSPPCEIIARQTNDPYATFVIDKGSDDGIKPYDPVVTSDGLVGVCYDVSTSTSKVRTLYSPKTAVGVYSVRKKVTGIIEGDVELAQKGLCRMNYIDKTADIKVGDIIITSGSQNFPASQLVGTVKETGMEDSGLSMYAVIEPAVKPTAITNVFVITSFKGQKLLIAKKAILMNNQLKKRLEKRNSIIKWLIYYFIISLSYVYMTTIHFNIPNPIFLCANSYMYFYE
jgi:rod shape-determining protein MreC